MLTASAPPVVSVAAVVKHTTYCKDEHGKVYDIAEEYPPNDEWSPMVINAWTGPKARIDPRPRKVRGKVAH